MTQANRQTHISTRWEEVFRSTPWARYPSEEMIRFVVRTFSQTPDRSKIRFLDLGCGIGTSCWYLAKEGYTAEGIDCAPSAIDFANQWFSHEKLTGTFQVGLMQKLPYDNHSFDCVIDNGSSTSTPLPVIQEILNAVKRVLKPGGHYYGMFLGDETTISGIQNPNSDDPLFYEAIDGGPIQRAATVRLLNHQEIQQLFASFNNVTIDYVVRTLNNQKERVQYWIVSAST